MESGRPTQFAVLSRSYRSELRASSHEKRRCFQAHGRQEEYLKPRAFPGFHIKPAVKLLRQDSGEAAGDWVCRRLTR
jgi:hypothetical protein